MWPGPTVTIIRKNKEKEKGPTWARAWPNTRIGLLASRAGPARLGRSHGAAAAAHGRRATAAGMVAARVAARARRETAKPWVVVVGLGGERPKQRRDDAVGARTNGCRRQRKVAACSSELGEAGSGDDDIDWSPWWPDCVSCATATRMSSMGIAVTSLAGEEEEAGKGGGLLRQGGRRRS